MFDWFSKEIEKIHTNKFHILEKVDPKVIEGMHTKYGGLPKSYHVFFSTFGKAFLYQKFSGCLVGVYPLFEETTSKDKGLLYRFGHYDTGSAYFRSKDILGQAEAPVFELGTPKQVAPDFATWLHDRCQFAKKQYTKKEWESILRGPKPFDKRETAIVEARKLFEWELIERTEQNTFRFRIKNNSEMTLPYLSIGVRHCDNKFVSGIWIPVGDIGPGQTGEVEKFYPDTPVEELEVFAKPDPGPEERDRYWEFRKITKTQPT